MLLWIIKSSLLISLLFNGCSAASLLRICPSDTVVFPNDTVQLRCGAEPDHMLRWYRGSAYSDVIFTGKSMMRSGAAADSRYDVVKDGSGNAALVITAVRPSDAGVYKCRDMQTNAETDVNIVVMDPETRYQRTVNVQQNSATVRHCSFTVHGQLKPVVEWVDKSGQLLHDVSSQTDVTGHVIESTTDDPRAAECQLTFQLFSCGQLADKIHFKWHQKLDDEDVAAVAVIEHQMDAMPQVSSMSPDQPINAPVLFVWAGSATVLVLILLCVTFWQHFKIAKERNCTTRQSQSEESLIKTPMNVSTLSGTGTYEILRTSSCKTVAEPADVSTQNGCYSDLQFVVYDVINNAPSSDNNQQYTHETHEQSADYLDLLSSGNQQ